MLHHYTSKDISACLHSRRIVLIGDSTIRQIFWAIAKKLDEEGARLKQASSEKHSDMVFDGGGVGLDFFWDPFLNSTRLHPKLINRARVNGSLTTITTTVMDNPSAAIFLIGGGLWHARSAEPDMMEQFHATIQRFTTDTGTIDDTNAVGPRMQSIGAEIFFAPVQVPLYESLSASRIATITPARIDAMNDFLKQLSADRRLNLLWSYSLMTSGIKVAYDSSGLHVAEGVARNQADILLNLRCNSVRRGLNHYPYDRTCCNEYSKPGMVQQLILVCLIGVPILYLVGSRGEHLLKLQTRFS